MSGLRLEQREEDGLADAGVREQHHQAVDAQADAAHGRGAVLECAEEVLVAVHASALNRLDLLQRRGRYPIPHGVRADIPGVEMAGVIEAVAWRGGRKVGRRKLETVGAAARLRLVPERTDFVRDRLSLAFVSIEVLDAEGRALPDDKRPISLTIDGPAELIAFGSAEPFAVGSLTVPQAHTFRGRALAILRSTGAAGTVRIKASTPDLATAVTSLRTA